MRRRPIPGMNAARLIWKVIHARHIWLWPVGAVICTVPLFNRYMTRLLGTWRRPHERGLLQRLVFPSVLLFWSTFRYRRERDPDRREALQALLWGQGSAWEAARDFDGTPVDVQLTQRIAQVPYSQRVPLLPDLEAALAAAAAPLLVCQIGASSGREVAWLAERHPNHAYLGTDVSGDAVSYAAERYSLPNMGFRVLSAKDIGLLLREIGERSEVIVFSHGCLQYVQPEHVRQFFESLAGIPRLRVALAEPVDLLGEPIQELRGSRPRASVAFSHNYRFYAENAGIVTDKAELGGRRDEGKATYIYWGRAHPMHDMERGTAR